MEESIEGVIAKLKIRFKEKFSIEEVSDRDLSAERKALEVSPESTATAQTLREGDVDSN